MKKQTTKLAICYGTLSTTLLGSFFPMLATQVNAAEKPVTIDASGLSIKNLVQEDKNGK
ncbi:hypothetical protein [Bacillus cereus]|uniref:hypothetical protein n=1 Tax=Bacillus cereus TaxID=1396 RepID=UPI0018CCEB9E|nr:hypothetical protein [Bacillus cereus]